MADRATAPVRRRPRRGAPRGLTVAVTGAAGVVGTAVLRALSSPSASSASSASSTSSARSVAAGGVTRVIAVDDRRGAVDGVQWRLARLDDPTVVERLRGADVVVHLTTPAELALESAEPAGRRSERVLRSGQAVVTAAAAVGASRVVLVSSAAVYGALPDNPVPLREDGPLRAERDGGQIGDLLAIEDVVDRARRAHPQLGVSVLRPAALVGPGVDTVVSRHFEAPRLLAVAGSETAWQFCHVDDLADAVVAVVGGVRTGGLTGSIGVGCDGTLTAAAVERLSGMRRLELPASLAFATANRLHRARVLPTPPGELAFAVYPWAVSTTRLTEHGWRPRYDNETALGVLLTQVQGHHAVAARRLERRDAVGAAGAAGAAVALVGTAALLRRARRRR